MDFVERNALKRERTNLEQLVSMSSSLLSLLGTDVSSDIGVLLGLLGLWY